MKTTGAINHASEAIAYALAQLGNQSIITPRGMIHFNALIKSYVSKEIYDNQPLYVMNRDEVVVYEAAYEYVLQKINQSRQDEDDENYDNQMAVAHYGPWVVNQDGTVDYGGNEVYYHGPDWHEDENHLSHMMTKIWLKDTADDYLRALAHSAKIQGVKSFTVNVEQITTEQ